MTNTFLTKQQLYEIYQSNLIMCEIQIDIIKKNTNKIIGEYHWNLQNNPQNSRLDRLRLELQASQRLYMFLLGNWFELRLYKILYESSRVSFNEIELDEINQEKSIGDLLKLLLIIYLVQKVGRKLLEIILTKCFKMNILKKFKMLLRLEID